MKIGGDIPKGGVTIFPMMSKGEKYRYQKRNIRSMKTGGLSPRGIPFYIDLKGG
jgi:hypothetical protein